jgi:hypothetical protein
LTGVLNVLRDRPGTWQLLRDDGLDVDGTVPGLRHRRVQLQGDLAASQHVRFKGRRDFQDEDQAPIVHAGVDLLRRDENGALEQRRVQCVQQAVRKNGWAASAGGFPAMTGNIPFLMKDVVLLAVSIYLLK